MPFAGWPSSNLGILLFNISPPLYLVLVDIVLAPLFSEDTSGSTAFHVDWRESTSKLKENSALDGDFLTLGHPATASSSMNSESNQPLAFPTSHYPKFSDFELPQSQVN